MSFEGAGYQGGFHNESIGYTNPLSGRVVTQQKASIRGGYVLSRLLQTFSPKSSVEVLAYCDWTDRASYGTEARTTCSAEVQHNLKISRRHSLIWGAGILGTDSAPYRTFSMRTIPGPLHNVVVSGLAQYDLVLVPDRFRLIAGSKFERNTFTGFEIQPQLRGVWTPHKANTVWGAVSRSVRTPTQIQETQLYPLIRLLKVLPTFLTVSGNANLQSEALRAYEVGYRFEPLPEFSLDTTIFYNLYDNLINVNLVNPMQAAGPPIIHRDPLYIEVPVPWQNLGSGQTHGAEIYAKFRPLKR